MGNVFIHVTMSLDGLIARPNDTIDCPGHLENKGINRIPGVLEGLYSIKNRVNQELLKLMRKIFITVIMQTICPPA